MKSQVQNVESILDMRSGDEVQDRGLMVGLWGMGCLGKTTLAKLIYNRIFTKFQDAAFIEIGSDSIKNLQITMLRALTHAKLRVINRHGGIASMKERLKCKKILLILDGAEDIRHIDGLIGKGSDYLKNGSRIIVTTRNKRVLRTRGATIYEVKALEDHAARQLLRAYASKNGEEGISKELVERALQCTGRVPSALRVLGSGFCGQNKNKNDGGRGIELKIFESWSDPTIHKELVKSFDGLKDATMEGIFLDIACFFNGWNRKYVEGFLGIRHVKRSDADSYDVVAHIANDHVTALVERSLITDDNGTLQVHPLIKLMGQKVADGEVPLNLKKRSRLWCWDDVAKALSDDEGEYDVEAIVCAPEETKELKYIDSSAFKRLKKLSFLIMINVQVKTFPDCIDLPRQLRWFEWPEFPASRLKFSPTPWNPAVLAVRKSLSSRNQGEP
ncbi:disease resistance protein Roq1-like [Rhodamnia argentea]|uniref:Disease resistance protein Roq1-like n=1 Tax=Rhodamnia argentea TaxID=178133 RepID=A0A8B8MUC6_9MYRT|nr:disease resistance protein Roq1-like [Rhodamnia argentea]